MDDSISENARGKRQRSDSGDQDLMTEFDDLRLNPNDKKGDDNDDDDDGMEFILDSMPALTLDANGGIIDPNDGEALLGVEHNPRGVVILLRVCFNNSFVTPVYHIPAHRIGTMHDITQFIEQRLPITFQNTYNETLEHSPMPILSIPTFLLQETSFKARKLRFSRWICLGPDGVAFRQWYIRNVYQGQEVELKLEVRIRADGNSEDFDMIRQVGEGRLAIGNQMYSQLDPEIHYTMIWDQLCRRNPAFSGPLTETSTHEYFPERRHKYQASNQASPASQQGSGAGSVPEPEDEGMDVDA